MPVIWQVLPLGTGNDLSLTFGWGNTFLPAWLRDFASVYHLLRRIADAAPRQLDCWHVDISAGAARFRTTLVLLGFLHAACPVVHRNPCSEMLL